MESVQPQIGNSLPIRFYVRREVFWEEHGQQIRLPFFETWNFQGH